MKNEKKVAENLSLERSKKKGGRKFCNYQAQEEGILKSTHDGKWGWSDVTNETWGKSKRTSSNAQVIDSWLISLVKDRD